MCENVKGLDKKDFNNVISFPVRIMKAIENAQFSEKFKVFRYELFFSYFLIFNDISRGIYVREFSIPTLINPITNLWSKSS